MKVFVVRGCKFDEDEKAEKRQYKESESDAVWLEKVEESALAAIEDLGN
jgi:hypothetical protein